MNLFARIKAAFSPEKFYQSSVSFLPGLGLRGAVYPEFNYTECVKAFKGWVFAAANLNAVAAASVPLRLYVDKGSLPGRAYRTRKPSRKAREYLAGGALHLPGRSVLRKIAELGDDYEEVTDEHPLLTLLSEISPDSDGYQFQLLRHLQLQLTGNAYVHWTVDEGAGWPNALYLLLPQLVRIIPEKPPKDRLVKAYLYGQSTQPEEFQPDEIRHFRYPHPRSVFYGLGRVEAGWDIVVANQLVHDFDLALYANQARPDYAAIVRSGSSPEQIERFEKKLNAAMRGVNKAGKVIGITGDIELKPLNFPPKDLTGREGMIEEIASVFGVPVTKLKANDPNRANAETGDAGWKADTILPMLRQDEEALNAWLLPLFGLEESACLAYDNPVPEDRRFAVQKFVAYATAGIMTRNEIRGELGLPEIEGGDELLIGTGLQPIDRASEEPQAPALPPGGPFRVRPPGLPEPGGDGEELEDVGSAAGKTVGLLTRRATFLARPRSKSVLRVSDLLTGAAKHHKSDSEEADLDARLDSMAEQYAAADRAVAAVLAKQRKLVVEWLEAQGEARGKAIPPSLRRDLTKFVDDLVKAMTEPVEFAVGIGGNAGNATIGVDTLFDVTDPRVADWLRAYTIRLAGEVNAHTIRHVNEAVSTGLDEGKTHIDIANDMRDDVAFSGYRANMIARTEMARAHQEGVLRAWKGSDRVQGKYWLAAPGACEFCQEAAAQYTEDNPIPLESNFFELGESLAATDIEGKSRVMILDYEPIARPPLHPHCGCDVRPVLLVEERHE